MELIEGGIGGRDQPKPPPQETKPASLGKRAIRLAGAGSTKLISIPLSLIAAPAATVSAHIADPLLVKFIGGPAYATAWIIDTVLRGAEKVIESGLATRTIQGLTPATRGVVERTLSGAPPEESSTIMRLGKRLYRSIVPWGASVSPATEAVAETAAHIETQEKAMEKAHAGRLRRGFEYGVDVVRQVVPGFFRAMKSVAITPLRSYITEPLKDATYRVWTHPEKVQEALQNAGDRANSYSSRLWHAFTQVHEMPPKEKLPLPTGENQDISEFRKLSREERDDILYTVCNTKIYAISTSMKKRLTKAAHNPKKADIRDVRKLVAIYEALPAREKECLTPSLFNKFDELSKIKLFRIVHKYAKLTANERDFLLEPDLKHIFRKGDWATIPLMMRRELEFLLIRKFNDLPEKHKEKMLTPSPEQYETLTQEAKEAILTMLIERRVDAEALTIDDTIEILRLTEKVFTKEERFFLLSELFHEEYILCPTTRQELTLLIEEQQKKIKTLRGEEREKTVALINWLQGQQKAFKVKEKEEIGDTEEVKTEPIQKGEAIDLRKIDQAIGPHVGPLSTHAEVAGSLFTIGLKGLGLASWATLKGIGYFVKPHGILLAEDSPLRGHPLFAKCITPDGYLVGSKGLSSFENWLEIGLKSSATAIDLILMVPLLHPSVMSTLTARGIPAYAIEDALKNAPAAAIQPILTKANDTTRTSELAMKALIELQTHVISPKDPRVIKTMQGLQVIYHLANATSRYLQMQVSGETPQGELRELPPDDALKLLQEKSLALVLEDEEWKRRITKSVADVSSTAAFTLRMISGSFLLLPEALRMIVPPMLHELAHHGPKGAQAFFYSVAEQSYAATDSAREKLQEAIKSQGESLQTTLTSLLAGSYVAERRIINFLALLPRERDHLVEVALDSHKLSDDERTYLEEHMEEHDAKVAEITLKAYDRLSAQEKLLLSPTYFQSLTGAEAERIIDIVEEKVGLLPEERKNPEIIVRKFNSLPEDDKEASSALSVWEFTKLAQSVQKDIFFAVAHSEPYKENPLKAYHRMVDGLTNKELQKILIIYSRLDSTERALLTPARLKQYSLAKIDHAYSLIKTYRADLLPVEGIEAIACAFNQLRPQQKREFLLFTQNEVESISEETLRELVIFLMGCPSEEKFSSQYKEMLLNLDHNRPIDKLFLVSHFNALEAIVQAEFRDKLSRDELSREDFHSACEKELDKAKARLQLLNDKLARHEGRFQGLLLRQQNAASESEREKAAQSLKDRAKLIDTLHAERSKLLAEASTLKSMIPEEMQKKYKDVETTTLPQEWLPYIDDAINLALNSLNEGRIDTLLTTLREFRGSRKEFERLVSAERETIAQEKQAHLKAKRAHNLTVIGLQAELEETQEPEKKIELRMKISFIKTFYYKLHDMAIERLNSFDQAIKEGSSEIAAAKFGK